eukprot:PhF_6_TR4548/c0_g1_i1/m.6418/K00111/glpA, glpD; glycerol-3-phosphate dehydrogenase
MSRRTLRMFSFRLSVVAGVSSVGYVCYQYRFDDYFRAPITAPHHEYSRKDAITKFQEQHFDVVVVGGGIIGLGVALDAATRGLTVGVVDREDWGSGASSGTARVVLSGNHEVELGVKQRDPMYIYNAIQSLRERSYLRANASELCDIVPMTAVFSEGVDRNQFYGLMKLFDIISFPWSVSWGRFVSKAKLLETAPIVNAPGILGGVQWKEVIVNDARLCTTLAMNASAHGAAVLNYAEVTKTFVLPDDKGVGLEIKLRGPCDQKIKWNTTAKLIINCTSHNADNLMQSKEDEKIFAGGVLQIPMFAFSAEQMKHGTGLCLPRTRDGANVGLIPNGDAYVLSGTEDSETELKRLMRLFNPLAFQHGYLEPMAKWYLPRGHFIARNVENDPGVTAHRTGWSMVEKNGIYTIFGGTLSSYRRVAKEALNDILTQQQIKAYGDLARKHPIPRCRTHMVQLTPKRTNSTDETTIHPDPNINARLKRTYGSKAIDVVQCGDKPVGGGLLEGDIVWAIKEGAQSARDVLFRTQLYFSNHASCREALPAIQQLMTQRLGGYNVKTDEKLRTLFVKPT